MDADSARSVESLTPHWSALARRWELTGSPLRPTAEDLAAYLRFALEWSDRHGPPRVLLLGVTPELYRLPWPAGRSFLAVDHTRAMVNHIWPGSPEEVLLASWTELPLPPASRDLALCDGGLHLLDYPHSQRRMVERLHDILISGGRCIFRLFTPPPERESPSFVMAELLAGRIPNLNVLKLRLGMALQTSPATGVELGAIWRALRSEAAGWEALAARVGWPLEHLSVIDTYRDSAARYYFITRAEAEGLFCAEGRFAVRGAQTPNYPLGERCPVVVFERQ